ncbi:glycoside hydrolase family protein [Caballeronia choica]|uniref:Lysozyme n=1 Tax=Caballeronia choica TaxID=326476 RepID=A0A158FJ16_9BURK|nr:hypothetical protein [Caballeronia choica]SAL19775.1 glycoside hydrolase family protein [Caballeronia choica]
MRTLPSRPGKKSLAVIVGTVVASMAISFTSSREGVSLKPYDDRLAGSLQTVCYGETNVGMRNYSLDECKEMLSESLAGYAMEVRRLTPGFDDLTDGQKVAVIDMAYNNGVEAYRTSTLRTTYGKRSNSRPRASSSCAAAWSPCAG